MSSEGENIPFDAIESSLDEIYRDHMHKQAVPFSEVLSSLGEIQQVFSQEHAGGNREFELEVLNALSRDEESAAEIENIRMIYWILRPDQSIDQHIPVLKQQISELEMPAELQAEGYLDDDQDYQADIRRNRQCIRQLDWISMIGEQLHRRQEPVHELDTSPEIISKMNMQAELFSEDMEEVWRQRFINALDHLLPQEETFHKLAVLDQARLVSECDQDRFDDALQVAESTVEIILSDYGVTDEAGVLKRFLALAAIKDTKRDATCSALYGYAAQVYLQRLGRRQDGIVAMATERASEAVLSSE